MTPSARLSRLPAAFLAAVLLASCGATGPTAAPGSPTPVPPVGTPGAPATQAPGASPSASSSSAVCDDSVEGAPAATSDAGDPDAATYTEIEAQVQKLRGITATAPVERGVFDTAGLCAYLRQSFSAQNPAALVKATEDLYKQLLLLPEDASLEQLYLDLLTSQVAGLYDDETKHMYVVSKGGGIGPVEEITYAHEFTHALQDQKFVLKSVVGEALDQSDRSMARSALVEGDATLLMSLWAQQHLTRDELAQVATSADPASEAVLASMPAILKDPLLFPYTSGLAMSLAAFTSGGFDGVNAIYANPPDSTEQLLHTDKLAARETPIAVTFPDDLASRLGTGWKISMQDTLGEFLLGVVLGEGGAPDSTEAAAGWGGDRVALLEGPGGEMATVIDTTWDSTQEATEYAKALEPFVTKLVAAGRSATVLRPAGERAVLIVAESPDTMGRVANVLGLAG